MKFEILPAHKSDLEPIDRFLEKEWSDYVVQPAPVALRERNWLPGNDSFGLRLLADGELVGYLGASYSARPIDGAMEHFCAIAPWFVKEQYRSESLRMLFRLLGDKDMTYVNLTPTRPMFKLFTSLGFAKLDEVKLLIPPLLNLAWLRPWRGILVTDPSKVRAVLKGADAKIFDDHAGTNCRHLAIVDGDRVAYIAAGRRILRKLPFSEILHVSEPGLLAPQFERIVWSLCRHFGVVGVASDARLLAGANIRAIGYKLNSPPLFKSPRIGRDKINNMWSELAY
jgi:hypothetical protein